MKRIISIVLLLMMVLSMNVSAYDVQYSDVFNNPIFEIVGELATEPGVPSPDAEVIYERFNTDDENSSEGAVAFVVEKLYSDGNYTVEDLFTMDAYIIEKATSRHPAYVKGSTEGKYVAYSFGDENGEFTDAYLVDTTGDEIKTTLLSSHKLDYDVELGTSVYTLYAAEEKDGAITRYPVSTKPVTWDEMRVLEDGTNYNDGIKYATVYEDEYESISGYSDINENVYFEDYGLGYFYYHYNLGYLTTVSNNGDALDYSLDNYEDQRVFQSTIKNVFTGEAYNFYDTDITDIYDSGYLMVYVKDASRVEKGYIAKLKKHAVMKVMVNGEKVLFDVLPTAQEGRTLVPLRAIFEALGADIEWNGDTQTILATKGDLSISLKIGSNIMTVDGVEKELQVPAQSIDGRTLVPVRAISEAFGCDVQWDQAKNAVVITY